MNDMHQRHRWNLCTGIGGVAVCVAVFLTWPRQRELNNSMTNEQTAAPPPMIDQEFLWDAESVGLGLRQFAWPQWFGALRPANAAAISVLFANGFESEISSQSKRIEVERESGWLR